MHVLSTGCQWRAVPKDLPPRSTLHDGLGLWEWSGSLERIHPALYLAGREQAGCETSPTAAIIDSQSVKSAGKGACIDPHGFDAGKKIKGKKRHVLVDTQGLMLHAIVHSAGLQDRDGGALLVATLFGLYPFLRKRYADAGYQRPRFKDAVEQVMSQLEVEIVKRSDAGRFVVLPERWLVERTIAWLDRCRRLAKDWENHSRNALAFLRLAYLRLMLRKLCSAT